MKQLSLPIGPIFPAPPPLINSFSLTNCRDWEHWIHPACVFVMDLSNGNRNGIVDQLLHIATGRERHRNTSIYRAEMKYVQDNLDPLFLREKRREQKNSTSRFFYTACPFRLSFNRPRYRR
ncbi:Uncharacterized protein APZ42_018943 [Daphnia magna]|uniref:Uncharacterized protein n=1 Tax=Daphnia magna TaxID=35525 RepID=A0A164YXJ4_9CRUS|nr:Uncharacterized protein APZ42_018943 [Daphnia magna]